MRAEGNVFLRASVAGGAAPTCSWNTEPCGRAPAALAAGAPTPSTAPCVGARRWPSGEVRAGARSYAGCSSRTGTPCTTGTVAGTAGTVGAAGAAMVAAGTPGAAAGTLGTAAASGSSAAWSTTVSLVLREPNENRLRCLRAPALGLRIADCAALVDSDGAPWSRASVRPCEKSRRIASPVDMWRCLGAATGTAPAAGCVTARRTGSSAAGASLRTTRTGAGALGARGSPLVMWRCGALPAIVPCGAPPVRLPGAYSGAKRRAVRGDVGPVLTARSRCIACARFDLCAFFLGRPTEWLRRSPPSEWYSGDVGVGELALRGVAPPVCSGGTRERGAARCMGVGACGTGGMPVRVVRRGTRAASGTGACGSAVSGASGAVVTTGGTAPGAGAVGTRMAFGVPLTRSPATPWTPGPMTSAVLGSAAFLRGLSVRARTGLGGVTPMAARRARASSPAALLARAMLVSAASWCVCTARFASALPGAAVRCATPGGAPR